MSITPRVVGPGVPRDHVKLNAVDTKVNILAIHTAEQAFHGQMYLPTDALEVYIGDYNGNLLKLSTQHSVSWILKGDGPGTSSVQNGAQINIVGSNGISSALVTDTLTLTARISAIGGNRITVESDGLYSPSYTAGSGISIVGNIISSTSLAITDVIVATGPETLGEVETWLDNVANTSALDEGDVVVFPSVDTGRVAYIHNGGVAGDHTDFTLIVDALTLAEIWAAFGLTGLGLENQIVFSTGSSWDYLTLSEHFLIEDGELTLTGDLDTNSWIEVGETTVKANGSTVAQWHNGLTVIGDGSSGTYGSTFTSGILDVWGDVAIMSDTPGSTGVILTDADGVQWRVTITTNGSIFTEEV